MGGEEERFEAFDLRKDGTSFPVEVHAKAMHVGGRVLQIAAVRDITERKRAEEALQHERRLLRTVIDNLPDGVYAKDTACRKTLANLADVRAMGRQSEAEVLGKTDFDFYSAENAAAYYADDQSVIQSGKPVVNKEETILDKEGKKHWYSTSKLPLRDEQGRIIGLVGVGKEITEQKRVEGALRHENALMDALMNNIPDSIYFKDRQCRLLRINRKMMQDLKLDDMSQAIGKTDIDLFGEEFGRVTLASDQRLMTIGRPVVGLTESRQLEDGRINWTSTTKVPMRDNSGEIIGLVGITREINEVMRANEEREQERNLLRTLIDNFPDYIFIKDTNSRFVVGNVAVVRQWGFASEEELIGKRDFDLFPPELAAQYYTDEQAIIQSGKGMYDDERPAVDASKEEKHRWVSTTKVPLRDAQGKIMGLVGIGRDITERKRAEEAFRRERVLLRTVIDNLPDGIYAKDTYSRKTLANLADLRTMGRQSEAEVLGKDDFDFFPKDVAEKFFADDQSVLKTGKPVVNREEYLIDAEGQKRWLLTSKLPLKDEGGRIIGLVGIGRDITKRKIAEDALRESAEKFRFVFENAYDGMSVFEETADRQLRKLVECNARYAEMSGRSREELLQIGITSNLARTLTVDERQSLEHGAVFSGSFSWNRPDGKENIIEYTAVPIKLQGKTFTIGIDRDVTERRRTEAEREKLIAELQSALSDVRTLSGLVPICANCKKIRDDKGYWTQLERYIQERSAARFSHGICPDCMKKLYPDLTQK